MNYALTQFITEKPVGKFYGDFMEKTSVLLSQLAYKVMS